MPLFGRRRGQQNTQGRLADFLEQPRDVNVDIHDELKHGGRRSHRLNVVIACITFATLIATIAGVIVTMQVREGVEDLGSMSAQEIVNRLRLGMGDEDLAALLGAPPGDKYCP